MMNEKDDLTVAYMAGYYEGMHNSISLTDEKIEEGIKAADPEGQDICPWSFKEGVKFALRQCAG